MKDSVLKKEFEKKDVTRLRNLLQGKYGEKTTQGIGYTKVEEEHNEGDIWEVDGRKWTIRNGIKQNITKLDKAKETVLLPLFCPQCSKIMNHPNNKVFYPLHKKCFDCVVEFETKLKSEGKYEEYEKSLHNSEMDSFINEFKQWADGELLNSNESFVTEQGDVENWIGGNEDKLKQNIEETIKFLETLKK